MPNRCRLTSRATLSRYRPRAAVIRICGSPKAIAVVHPNSPSPAKNGLTLLLLIMDAVIRQWDMPTALATTNLRSSTALDSGEAKETPTTLLLLCSFHYAERATLDLLWLPTTHLVCRNMTAPSADRPRLAPGDRHTKRRRTNNGQPLTIRCSRCESQWCMSVPPQPTKRPLPA